MKCFKKKLVLLALLVLVVILTGCNSKLNKVNPKSATPGTVIALKGLWFGEEPGEAAVYFGDTKAVITLWSKREINVKVPDGS